MFTEFKLVLKRLVRPAVLFGLTSTVGMLGLGIARPALSWFTSLVAVAGVVQMLFIVAADPTDADGLDRREWNDQ